MGIKEIFEGITSGAIGGLLGTIAGAIERISLIIKGDISPEAKAELEKMKQDLESKKALAEVEIEKARLSVMVAEAASPDKWTSRARPSFMYVIYIMLLASLPFAGFTVYDESAALKYVQGFHNWLNAIPTELYTLFGAGYLGYAGLRTYEKKKV